MVRSTKKLDEHFIRSLDGLDEIRCLKQAIDSNQDLDQAYQRFLKRGGVPLAKENFNAVQYYKYRQVFSFEEIKFFVPEILPETLQEKALFAHKIYKLTERHHEKMEADRKADIAKNQPKVKTTRPKY